MAPWATEDRQLACESRYDPSLMPSPANLFALIVFSVVGFAMFSYARKQGRWKLAGIAVALMVYPYFVDQTWLLYTIGLSLCAAMYVVRD